MSGGQFAAWLQHSTFVKGGNSSLVVGFPNAFAKETVDRNFRPMVKKVVDRIADCDVDLTFVIHAEGGPLFSSGATISQPRPPHKRPRHGHAGRRPTSSASAALHVRQFRRRRRQQSRLTPRPSALVRLPVGHITHSLSTAASAWAKLICSGRSATRFTSSTLRWSFDSSLRRTLPTSWSRLSAAAAPPLFGSATDRPTCSSSTTFSS